VDIHEIAAGVWVSTTRPDRAQPNVAAMTALDVTTPQQPSWDRPRPLLWLHVLARRGRLDRLLADGQSPAGDARLAMRARQLVHPPARARLAAALHDAVQSIDDPHRMSVRRPQLPVPASSVRACGSELRGLAHALTAPHPRARGVVLARDVLTDGSGPLYTDGMAEDLRNRIRAARSAL